MIWEPFILALVLGIIVSAGLYFAYLWPSVEPAEPPPDGSDLPVPVAAAASVTPAAVAPAAAATSGAAADDAPGAAP